MAQVAAVLAAFVPAVGWVWFFWTRDRYEREPRHLIDKLFVWAVFSAPWAMGLAIFLARLERYVDTGILAGAAEAGVAAAEAAPARESLGWLHLQACFWCLLADLPPWLWGVIFGAAVVGAAWAGAAAGLFAATAKAVATGAAVLGAHSLVTSACNFNRAYDRYQQTGDWNAARDAWRSGVETAHQIWAGKQPIKPPPFTPGTHMDTEDAPAGPLTIWRERLEKYAGP